MPTTQQSDAQRWEQAYKSVYYPQGYENVNWTSTGRPWGGDFEKGFREYSTWNQGPWSDSENVAKMASAFGQAPGYALAKGGLAKILGV